MELIYNPQSSKLGRIMRQECDNLELVNEYAWVPIAAYLHNYLQPQLTSHSHIHYLDIAAGTGLLSQRIAATLVDFGVSVTLTTTDIVNNDCKGCYFQSDAFNLPLKSRSVDFITLNLGFRYFNTAPQQVNTPWMDSSQATALKDNPQFLAEFNSKAKFLSDVLNRVLVPGGSLLLTITTEQPNQPIKPGLRTIFSLFQECYRFEHHSLIQKLRQFLRICLNSNSYEFLRELSDETVKAAHRQNHFFNHTAVTVALLEYFNGHIVYENPYTNLGLLHFSSPEMDA